LGEQAELVVGDPLGNCIAVSLSTGDVAEPDSKTGASIKIGLESSQHSLFKQDG
jgi:hypothetical protein